MNDHSKIPAIDPPVAFNPYKHHLGFLRDQIEKWRRQPWSEAEKQLCCIGNNLIDLYFGKLTVREICSQCIAFAIQKDLTTDVRLAEWLSPLEYRKTALTDTSLWVIRHGTESERFLHIHPARNSPYTIRVRAGTLKTVLAIKIIKKDLQSSDLDLATVNHIRKKNLRLSPIKKLERGKGIAGLWSFFHDPLSS